MKTDAVYSLPHPARTQKFNIEGFSPITRAATDRITVHSTPAPALASLTSAARAEHVNTNSVLGGLLSVAGRQAFTLTLEDGKLSKLERSESPSSHAPAVTDASSPLIGRKAVAQMLGCHPDTISRRGKELEQAGLIGKRLAGSSKRWRRDDVIAYAEKMGLTGKRKPGRPRKHF